MKKVFKQIGTFALAFIVTVSGIFTDFGLYNVYADEGDATEADEEEAAILPSDVLDGKFLLNLKIWDETTQKKVNTDVYYFKLKLPDTWKCTKSNSIMLTWDDKPVRVSYTAAQNEAVGKEKKATKETQELWERMTDPRKFGLTETITWKDGANRATGSDHDGKDADWEERRDEHNARTFRAQTTFKMDKNFWGRDILNGIHYLPDGSTAQYDFRFTVAGSKNRDKRNFSESDGAYNASTLNLDDGYWIFIYPQCVYDEINNDNMWNYFAFGAMWDDDGCHWASNMTSHINKGSSHKNPESGKTIKIYPSTDGTTSMKDENIGKCATDAIKYGYKQVKDRPDWDGTWVIDLWAFDINCSGSVKKPAFGWADEDLFPWAGIRYTTPSLGKPRSVSMQTAYINPKGAPVSTIVKSAVGRTGNNYTPSGAPKCYDHNGNHYTKELERYCAQRNWYCVEDGKYYTDGDTVYFPNEDGAVKRMQGQFAPPVSITYSTEYKGDDLKYFNCYQKQPMIVGYSKTTVNGKKELQCKIYLSTSSSTCGFQRSGHKIIGWRDKNTGDVFGPTEKLFLPDYGVTYDYTNPENYFSRKLDLVAIWDDDDAEFVDVSCIDKDKSGSIILGQPSPETKKYEKGATANGSDWGTSGSYSGYTYDSCSTIQVSGDKTKDIVYRYFSKSGPTPTPTPTPTPSSSDEYSYYYVNYHPNGGSGYIASRPVLWRIKKWTTVEVDEIVDGKPTGKKVPKPVSYYEYPDTTISLAYNSFSPPYGYNKQSGWSTSPGYRPGSGYWDYGITPTVYNGGPSYNEGQSVRITGNLDLYARWMPNKHKVFYDENHSAATLVGPDWEYIYFDQLIDVGTNVHSANRLGWDFLGWNRNQKDETVLSAPYAMKWDQDITLYAIFSHDMTLILDTDVVGHISKKTYSSPSDGGKIYTHKAGHLFNSQNVKNGTTRTEGKYIITFANNGPSELISEGECVATDGSGRRIATGLLGNNTIEATRYFVGWSDTIQTTGEGELRKTVMTDWDGTLVGGSGTSIFAEVQDYSLYCNYLVYGDVAPNSTADIYSNNRIITLYPQYTRAYIVLPDARRNKDKGPDDGTEDDGNQEDTFLGWFTKPQPENGGTGDGGEYYGKAGDLVRIDDEYKTLYPWFNIPPTIIHSTISSDFHEGQPVSYYQLMQLIDVFDPDNPVPKRPEGQDGYTTYSGERVLGKSDWLELYKIQADQFLKNEYGILDPDERARIIAEKNYDDFMPELVSATFYCDGLDPLGNVYSDVPDEDKPLSQTGNTIKARGKYGLDTSYKTVGTVDLTYRITDNGTYDGDTLIIQSNRDSKGNHYRVNSPITVTYVLRTTIAFNQLPRFVRSDMDAYTGLPKPGLVSTYMYSGDESITMDNVTEFLMKKQDAADACDDRDEQPWWYKSETSPALDDSIKIIEVYDINFSSGFSVEHPDKVAAVKEIKDIRTLFALKETDYDTFKHITDFKAEWDCVDQWGKTASGYLMPGFNYADNPYDGIENVVGWTFGEDRDELPAEQTKYGLSKEERSITVLMFNNQDDYDLVQSNAVVSQRVRYIDSTWADYLSKDSYWGDASKYGGASKLAEVFANYTKKPGHNQIHTTMKNNGNQINVIINDYLSQ